LTYAAACGMAIAVALVLDSPHNWLALAAVFVCGVLYLTTTSGD